MITHLAFFRFRSDLSELDIAKLGEAFVGLKGRIPEIRSARWVRNNSTEGLDRGFLYGIHMRFDSAEDRQAYLDHPEHVAFGRSAVIPSLQDGLRNSVLVFDFDD